jgi:hypothetical protein
VRFGGTAGSAPGGLKGPSGDVYLYSHFQVDAQGSYYLGKGFTAIASGLNPNTALLSNTFSLLGGSLRSSVPEDNLR